MARTRPAPPAHWPRCGRRQRQLAARNATERGQVQPFAAGVELEPVLLGGSGRVGAEPSLTPPGDRHRGNPRILPVEHHHALALKDPRLGGGVCGDIRIAIEMIVRNVEHRRRIGIEAVHGFELEAGKLEHPRFGQGLAAI